MRHRTVRLLTSLGVVGMLVVVGMLTLSLVVSAGLADTPPTGESDQAPKVSHRLIVELESPPLAVKYKEMVSAQTTDGRLDVDSTAAQQYVDQVRAEQAALVGRMQAALPGATVSSYINENGASVAQTFQVVLNAVVVDPGATNAKEAIGKLAALPGVKAVYRDYAYTTDLYTSTALINAPMVWNSPAIGGQANGGRGIKIASMDGGVHHAAPMFDGTGYSYPAGYPPGGLGYTANNNGKIIVSRAYFRSWDPPSEGDENPWPGRRGTPHGVHTSGIAGGNIVSATYAGYPVGMMSGVAPGAWIMSYRVFYNSVTNDGSFYMAEGIAALEDIVKDGPDVLNNSWGGGPGSTGGQFDPLDQALINAADSGIFVSMSAGNAGPGNGTTDHPSGNYINVAASSSSGTLASGRLNVIGPAPVVSPTLQDISFTSASFGPPLPIGTVVSYTYLAAANVGDGSNVEGCNPWLPGTFSGKAALISRGTCEFGVKVVNADQAGAEFVVVYNHTAGGDELINMGAGAVGDQTTVSSIFVGHTAGAAMVTWQTDAAAQSEDAVLELDTIAFQAGNTPDVITAFSSRGPGVGNVLKPDIAAPGVNILSQGYTPGASAEDRHLGYGQASGTSMAAPHVAGAAALLRQVYPAWTNAQIKSALMSTSQYMDIYNYDDTPAQPLDMGAGRLDVGAAMDPGVILDPPSLSFGQVASATQKTISVQVTNIATATESYTLTTLYTGDGFTQTTTLPGFSVQPGSLSLPPGGSASITITFDSAAGMGIGDNQGFILMQGDTHTAHMPAWARVVPAQTVADVLIIDNDGSSSLGFPDYVGYYSSTLAALGYTHHILDTDDLAGSAANFMPEAATLAGYRAVIYYTGDNFYPDGTFSVPTPLTALDMDRLTEYANSGGVVIAMGQDLSAVLDSLSASTQSFFYSFVLGGDYLQDSVSDDSLPSQHVIPVTGGPAALAGVRLDLSGPDTYLSAVELLGSNEVPTVTTSARGVAQLAYDGASRRLDYQVTISTTDPITVTASHIHSGTIGVNGPVSVTLYAGPAVYVTDTFTFDGAVLLTGDQAARMLAGATYINVHTTQNSDGEVRGQILPVPVGDGAANQFYIDEIAAAPTTAPDNPLELLPYTPLLRYPGPTNLADGIVSMAHRAQPTLENPGIAYNGRSIYTTFGLEGVNNGAGTTTRSQLLDTFFQWAWDEPLVTISETTVVTNASQLTTFSATMTSNITGTTGVSYRWDFGDDSGYHGPYSANVVSHSYQECGTFTVRVEAVNSFGNRAVGQQEIDVTLCGTTESPFRVNLPLIMAP